MRPNNRTDNPWLRVNAANSVAQLAALRRNARLQEAIQLRQAQQVLGVVAPGVDDEMLAGGNITIQSHYNPWPWVVGIAILALAILFAAWLIAGRHIATASTTTTTTTPVPVNPVEPVVVAPVNPPPIRPVHPQPPAPPAPPAPGGYGISIYEP
jgi:hypothetical protein